MQTLQGLHHNGLRFGAHSYSTKLGMLCFGACGWEGILGLKNDTSREKYKCYYYVLVA